MQDEVQAEQPEVPPNNTELSAYFTEPIAAFAQLQGREPEACFTKK